MKIYTKKGDTGTTQLLGGTRVPKHHLRIEAYGTVDELNSWMGMLGTQTGAQKLNSLILDIQHDLFTIGSHLANDPGESKFPLPPFGVEAALVLENSIDVLEADLPPLKNFVLPGGHISNSVAHIARTVCRRAERATTALHEQQPVEDAILQYLNRLSDWLFVTARWLAHTNGVDEIVWTPRG